MKKERQIIIENGKTFEKRIKFNGEEVKERIFNFKLDLVPMIIMILTSSVLMEIVKGLIKKEVKLVVSGKSMYHLQKRFVQLNVLDSLDDNDLEESWYHENGHKHDANKGVISFCDELLYALQDDVYSLAENNDKALIIDMANKSSRCIQDIIGGVTGWKLVWGHSKKYWSQDKHVVCAEFYAHVYASMCVDNRKMNADIRAWFPNGYAWFIQNLNKEVA